MLDAPKKINTAQTEALDLTQSFCLNINSHSFKRKINIVIDPMHPYSLYIHALITM